MKGDLEGGIVGGRTLNAAIEADAVNDNGEIVPPEPSFDPEAHGAVDAQKLDAVSGLTTDGDGKPVDAAGVRKRVAKFGKAVADRAQKLKATIDAEDSTSVVREVCTAVVVTVASA